VIETEQMIDQIFVTGQRVGTNLMVISWVIL
jgi:hypothetical protein